LGAEILLSAGRPTRFRALFPAAMLSAARISRHCRAGRSQFGFHLAGARFPASDKAVGLRGALRFRVVSRLLSCGDGRPSRRLSGRSSRAQIGGLGATRIGDDIEIDLLALVERAKSGCFHGADMDKHILAAAIRRK